MKETNVRLIESLRAKMEAIAPVGITPATSTLPRRAVTIANNCPALIVELIRQEAERGGFIAIIGWPELILTTLGELLERVIIVPEAGQQSIATLVEGMDLVVYKSPRQVQLSRTVMGKIRAGHAAVIMVDGLAQSPALRLEGHISAIHGLGQGVGRIRGIDIEVTAITKGKQHTHTLTIGEKHVPGIVVSGLAGAPD